MIEKRFRAVPPQFLTLDGNIQGLITIPETALFKVKQVVYLQIPGQSAVKAEIKRVDSKTTMYVGPVTGPIDHRIDTSMFTVAANAFIFAEWQQRPNIAEQEVERNTYEEEPIVARRVFIVDAYGDDAGSPKSAVNSDEPNTKFIYGNAFEVTKIIEYSPGAVVGDPVRETHFVYGTALEVIKIYVTHRSAVAEDLS